MTRSVRNSQGAEAIGRSTPDELERTVRLIFELANRGQYAQALSYYGPDTHLELAGGRALEGRYNEKSKVEDLMELAIKEYGQPRVHLEELHVVGRKVYVETSAPLANGADASAQSQEIHVLEFLEGKVQRHRVLTGAMTPPGPRAQRD